MIVTDKETITESWLAATEQLLAVGGDAFSSIVRVGRTVEPAEDPSRELLDAFLTSKDLLDTQAVANTIFPITLARHAPDKLFERYEQRIWPVIRRVPSNNRGTYFRRLIRFDGVKGLSHPLLTMIEKMRTQLGRNGPIRCAYELAVYRPGDDSSLIMGFPCLSHLSFKLDTKAGRVHVAALYRNQTYIQRLYGNLLGLGRLVAYVARHVDLEPGEVVCHAGHAELGSRISKGAAEGLVHSCRAAM